MSETEPLSDEVKYFIVQKLACFATPSEVAKDVKDEFGIVITRQRAQLYDPTKKAGTDLGAELKAIFEAIHRLAGVSFGDLEPLLDETLTCVQIMPTPERPDVIRALVTDDIEEVKTLSTLRMEVFRLHTGFSSPAKAPESPKAPAGDSQSNIRTSRRQTAR